MDWEQIEPGMPGLILLSHGMASIGVLDSVQLIYSRQKNMAAVTLDTGDAPQEMYAQIEKLYQAFQGNCIFFVDFNGGTPCNQLRIFSMKNGIQIFGALGFSVPMILSAVESRRSGADKAEIVRTAMLEGNEGIQELYPEMAEEDDES